MAGLDANNGKYTGKGGITEDSGPHGCAIASMG